VAAKILGNRTKPLFGVERGIIYYNHSILFKGRQELGGKPEFKKGAVYRPAILEGARILPSILAATMPQRLYLRPLLRPKTR